MVMRSQLPSLISLLIHTVIFCFPPPTQSIPYSQFLCLRLPLVLTFHPFNYKVRDVISRNFQILKNDPETSAIFTDNPLTSFRRNKNIRDNLVRSALRQNLPAPAGTFSCLHVFVPQLPHLFPDLNPISLFGIILHAPPPTSFTAFLQ